MGICRAREKYRAVFDDGSLRMCRYLFDTFSRICKENLFDLNVMFTFTAVFVPILRPYRAPLRIYRALCDGHSRCARRASGPRTIHDLGIYAATRYSTLQRTATHCNALQRTATHCNALQHTAAHCNTLQHTTTHCNTGVALGRISIIWAPTLCNTLQHTATHCNTLQHTATHCNTGVVLKGLVSSGH